MFYMFNHISRRSFAVFLFLLTFPSPFQPDKSNYFDKSLTSIISNKLKAGGVEEKVHDYPYGLDKPTANGGGIRDESQETDYIN